jgi:hypothetical protein
VALRKRLRGTLLRVGPSLLVMLVMLVTLVRDTRCDAESSPSAKKMGG